MALLQSDDSLGAWYQSLQTTKSGARMASEALTKVFVRFIGRYMIDMEEVVLTEVLMKWKHAWLQR